MGKADHERDGFLFCFGRVVGPSGRRGIDMSDRTYGETSNCAGCRFWSEMIAQAIGGGPVTAMCLAGAGRYAGKYTSARMRCDSWKSGHFGAVDDPPDYGEETRRLYAEEDSAAGGGT